MQRRNFLHGMLGAVTVSRFPAETLAMAPEPSWSAPTQNPNWRAQFPALEQRINGRPLVYLDTAATSLRPRRVIDAVSRFYEMDNANPGAALHTLARRASQHLEGSRKTVAQFIGAQDPLEVIFTRGTTEAINVVAFAWSLDHVKAGDEILIGIAEHSSNMLPWQYAARRQGAIVRYFDVDANGRPRLDDLRSKLSSRTRVVAFSHVSNVLGLENPIREMCDIARGPNRVVVVDGAQSLPHFPVNVSQLGCDFLAFSSHKMLGPMGVGVLWGRRELIDRMSPYQLGSNMAHDVELTDAHLSDGALKFGAGTPNVSGPAGLAAATAVLSEMGMAAVREHEKRITSLMLERLRRINGVRLLGADQVDGRISVFSLALENKAPIALVRAMDEEGIAIRAGDLASLPLLKRLGVQVAARASAYVYTTPDEVGQFADRLEHFMRT